MAETVPVAFVHAYTREIHRLSAQRVTKLRSAVRVETGITGKTYNFERLGASDLQTVNTRHAPTPILNPVHSRRKLNFFDKGGAILKDPQDQLKMLIEPNNKYAQNHADSANRNYDDQIIAALTGNSQAVDEQDATSNITLASFASGVHDIGTDGSGLTFTKVNTVVKLLNKQDIPFEDRFACISPDALEDLLAVTQVTSSDFTSLQAIKFGTIPAGATWMGFQWIISTRLPLAGAVRTLLFWQKQMVGLGIAQEINVEIDRRTDLSNAWQIFASVSSGATRIEEAGVVNLDITE
jgi:hypothetical protein